MPGGRKLTACFFFVRPPVRGDKLNFLDERGKDAQGPLLSERRSACLEGATLRRDCMLSDRGVCCAFAWCPREMARGEDLIAFNPVAPVSLLLQACYQTLGTGP